MIIKCDWCGKITSKPPYGGHYEDEVTDGICERCLKIVSNCIKKGVEHAEAIETEVV
jgi:hypothetical protein